MELLIPDITIEECAEVIQCITKIKRFGFENNGYNNKKELEKEIGQLHRMLQLLSAEWKLDMDTVLKSWCDKEKAVHEYAVYNVCNQPVPTA